MGGAPLASTPVRGPIRVGHRDFAMGGDMSPPIGGGQMGGDEAYMGGDLRVNFPTVFRDVFFKK